MDIEKLRLTLEDIAKVEAYSQSGFTEACVNAQLAKALWGMIDASDALEDALEAAGIPRPGETIVKEGEGRITTYHSLEMSDCHHLELTPADIGPMVIVTPEMLVEQELC